MDSIVIDSLKSSLDDFKSALDWLNHSYELCRKTGIKDSYSVEELDIFENLTSRYARTTDFLIHKLFRSIDAVEFLDGGTIIDSANRAVKRGFVESINVLHSLKDLRNEITHEYTERELKDLFSEVLKSVPLIIGISNKVFEYCKKYSSN
jgi:hypothetical protein